MKINNDKEKNIPKGWYNVVVSIKEKIKKYPADHPATEMNTRLDYEANLLLELFRECLFAGFDPQDTEANEIINHVMVTLQKPFENIEFPELNPFQNLLYGFYFLQHTLALIKDVYIEKLPSTLKHLEDLVYNSEDYNMLLNASKTIGRNVINKTIHPDFQTIKLHIGEQLAFLKGKQDFKEQNKHQPNELSISFQSIVQTIHDLGKQMEMKPSMYMGKNEEGLRDIFIGLLDVHIKNAVVSGETFNVNGKTDIIIKDNQSNNLFIGECKWWGGPSEFLSAINQVMDNYVHWRYTDVAFLFFVDNKDFTKVLQQIPIEAAKHPFFTKYLGSRNETIFTFHFCHKLDKGRCLKIEMIFFHFPNKESKLLH